jgi:hypothetical protein
MIGTGSPPRLEFVVATLEKKKKAVMKKVYQFICEKLTLLATKNIEKIVGCSAQPCDHFYHFDQMLKSFVRSFK